MKFTVSLEVDVEVAADTLDGALGRLAQTSIEVFQVAGMPKERRPLACWPVMSLRLTRIQP